jgi:hypothetical protein
LRTEEPEPESDSCIKRSRLPGALPKRRSRLAKPPALASREPSGERNADLLGVGTRVDGAFDLSNAPALPERPGPACFGSDLPVTSLEPALLRQVTPRHQLASPALIRLALAGRPVALLRGPVSDGRR